MSDATQIRKMRKEAASIDERKHLNLYYSNCDASTSSLQFFGSLMVKPPQLNVRGKKSMYSLGELSPETPYFPTSSKLTLKENPIQAALESRSYLMPSEIVESFGHYISPYEHAEVLNYQQIFYFGEKAKKIIGGPRNLLNYGYDDEDGNYQIVAQDHIAYRYEVIKILGKGSFGQVVKAFDHGTGKYVALKIIRNKKRFHQQGLVEVKILDHIKKMDPNDMYNVVHMDQHFFFRNHLCIAFELLGTNLYEYLKARSFKGLELDVIKRIATQLLHSLSLLQSNGIIHCDLKPENVLLRLSSAISVKLIDFGSSCFSGEKTFSYIQSRFYRSPEVILGINYESSIDMWSFGCMLAELYTGRALLPGENEADQLSCIMEILGVPPQHLVSRGQKLKALFEVLDSTKRLNSKGIKRIPKSRTISSVIKCQEHEFLDLIMRCLTWDPLVRISPIEALCHPWIKPKNTSASSGIPAFHTPQPWNFRSASLPGHPVAVVNPRISIPVFTHPPDMNVATNYYRNEKSRPIGQAAASSSMANGCVTMAPMWPCYHSSSAIDHLAVKEMHNSHPQHFSRRFPQNQPHGTHSSGIIPGTSTDDNLVFTSVYYPESRGLP